MSATSIQEPRAKAVRTAWARYARPPLLAIGIVAAAPLAAAPPSPATMPAWTSEVAGLPHVIPVEGASNFRDIGGYRTLGGRRVRTGLVYRSASTDDLTAADFRLIDRLGVRLFCDLRDAPERRPRRPAGVRVPPIQTWPDQPPHALALNSPEAASRAMQDAYARMPFSYALQIGDIFRHVARGELPILYNCSGGKDRTGLTTALLLSLLGVPRAAIMDDYLASNRLFDANAARRGPGDRAPLPSRLDPAVTAVLVQVRPEWLNTSFAAIAARYGSLDRYWREGLRLSPQEIAAIRRRLLE